MAAKEYMNALDWGEIKEIVKYRQSSWCLALRMPWPPPRPWREAESPERATADLLTIPLPISWKEYCETRAVQASVI